MSEGYEAQVRRAALTHVATIRVLHADTDAMGIVYHGAYLRWLEQARVELMRSNGVVYTDLEAQGFGLPVAELEVRYFSPAVYDEMISLEVAMVELRRAQLSFGYRLLIPAGGTAAGRQPREVLVARTRHACISLDTGRPKPFPDAVVTTLRSCY